MSTAYTATLAWDKAGERLYETGVEKGVLYLKNGDGEYIRASAWNGLISVTESPSGAEANPLYANDIKYLNLISAEEFGATIEAYTYPEDFAECDGSKAIGDGVYIGQQTRAPFGLCYRTAIGNDTDGDVHGYKLHLIYEAIASPSEKTYTTINDSPEAITFSWEITTTPVEVPGYKPTAHIEIDSTKISEANLKAIENILYGDGSTFPKLPMPSEILAIIGEEE